ncbi:hypothetical protein [Variovorax saccharolyticus]|uniref:hypothetical protein n=1 Tax=Variovorax saccharolyticus TaxID=3053516 RepID=UPI0025768301|nr:hypothetical protein [Variovorax sp. J31P216]MDM0027582.1 hypothetical protein [Variovorax sp. J31P216]
MRRLWPVAMALVLALSGCALDPTRLPLGSTRAETLQKLGNPTATYAMPGGGERLQYSRAPAGVTVNNVDLDASGRVVSIRQELEDGMFDITVKPGVWRVDDVLRSYGRPFEVSQVLAFNGDIWTWHYQSLNNPRLFYIYIDPDGVVDHYHTADDQRRLMTDQ